MFDIKDLEKIKTHFMVNTYVLNCVIYQTMRKNRVEPDRPQI